MTSIAQAYVEILPSAKGMERALQGQMGGLESTMGESSRRGILGGLGGVGGAMVGAIGIGAIVGAGAAIGSTLSRGLTRSLNLQDARAQLTGLGHDAEGVEAIMSSALDSVRGTAFGLDSAATTAASAVAAGVQPGEDLTRMLSLVGDAATIAGTDMSSMGSIFNKVATSDMMQMDVANQLMDAGIPIMQLLGEQMGVTADQVRDMASRGEIDFATFQSAIESGMGGAALASGDTARGAFANVGAAVGRLGAMFTGAAVAGAPTLFQSIAGAVDSLAEALAPAAEQLGGVLGPALEGLAGWIDALDFSTLLSGGGAFGELASQVLPLAAAFSPLMAVGEALLPLLPQITDLVVALAPSLLTLGESLTGAAVVGIQALANVLIPVIDGLVGFIGWITPAADLLTSLAVGIGAVVAVMKIWQIVTAAIAVVQGVLNVVMAANPISIIIIAIAALVAGLIWFFTQTELGQQIWANFTTFLGEAWANVSAWFMSIGATISAWWTGFWQGISDFFSGIWEGIVSFITMYVATMIAIYTALGSTISAWWNGLWQGVSDFFTSIWDGVINAVTTGIDNIVGFITGIPDRVMAVLGGIGDLLVNSGASLIQGFIDGITGMIDNVGAAIGGVMDFVGGFFPNSPAKHGPLSGSGWRAIGQSGSAIEDAFAAGFTGRIDDVLTSGVQVPRVPVSAEVAGHAAGVGGGPTVNVYPSQAMDANLVGRIAGDEMASALRGV